MNKNGLSRIYSLGLLFYLTIKDVNSDVKVPSNVPRSPSQSLRLIPLNTDLKTSTQQFKYHIDESGRVETFVAKNPFIFESVYRNDKLLWKAKYPRFSNRITLRRKRNGKKLLRVFYPSDETGPFEIATPEIRLTRDVADLDKYLFHLDISQPRSSRKYKYFWDDRNFLAVFTAKTPFRFHSVSKGRKLIWKSRKSKYPFRVMVGVKENGTPSLTLFYHESEIPISQKPKTAIRGHPEPREPKATPVKERTPKPKTSRLVSDDLSRKRVDESVDIYKIPDKVPVQLDISVRGATGQYTFSKKGDTGTFTAISDFAFNSVVRKRENIWSSYKPSEYASKVVIDGVSFLKSTNTVTIYHINDEIKQFYTSESKWFEKINKIDLDITKRKSTFYYDYSEHDGTSSYLSKNEYVFTGVIEGSYLGINKILNTQVEIWRAENDSEYSTKIETRISFMQPISYITIYSKNGNIKHFYKARTSLIWTEMQPSLELDLEKTTTGYEYNYSQTGSNALFTANYNFTFTKLLDNKTEIWSAPHRSESAIRVRVNPYKRDTVTAYLKNGNIRTFYHSSENDSWCEQYVTIYTQDGDDPSTFTENDTSKYNLRNLDNIQLTEYQIEPGERCVKFGVGETTIWKYDPKTGRHPTSLYTHPNSQIIYARFSDTLFHFYRLDDSEKRWKLKSLKKAKQVLGHVKVLTSDPYDPKTVRTMEPHCYEALDMGFVHVLVFKPGSECTGIMCSKKMVYKHDPDDDNGNYPIIAFLMSDFTAQVIYKSKSAYCYGMGKKKVITDFISQTMQRSSSRRDLVSARAHDYNLSETEEGGKKFSKSDIKLFTYDKLNPNRSQRMDSSNYRVRKRHGVFVFEFLDGARCTGVKCDNMDVWKYDKKTQECGFPIYIDYYKNKVITIVFDQDLVIYFKDKGEWVMDRKHSSIK